MDSLMLDIAARSLAENVAGLEIRSIREESPHRIRWVLEGDSGPRSFLICLEPGRPWLARPHGPWPESGRHPGPLTRALQGCVGLRLIDLAKDPLDRLVRLSLSDGSSLSIELLPQRPNATLLDPAGRVVVSARVPKTDRDRLSHGAEYRPPSPPPASSRARGVDGADAVERNEIVDRIRAGALIPCIEGDGAVELSTKKRISRLRDGKVGVERLSLELRPADGGEQDPESLRLQDPAGTIGLFYEACARFALTHARERSLRSLLAAEAKRVAGAAARARQDAEGFEDPSRHRIWGEALLAGLDQAKVDGSEVSVTDPYGDGEVQLTIPIDPRVSLQRNAERHFVAFRRAQRGAEQAARRRTALEERGERLHALSTLPEGAVEELERGLRAEGVPVGLESGAALTGSGKGGRERLTGVRVFTDTEGWEVLVGRGAKENHRLTFKVAGPEDFWFHALGVTGAHVILRLPSRGAKPSDRSIREAASMAAWFSEGRSDDAVDVQYTRRKFVRRPRGAPAGTVVLKRFDTIRVKPVDPDPLGSGR